MKKLLSVMLIMVMATVVFAGDITYFSNVLYQGNNGVADPTLIVGDGANLDMSTIPTYRYNTSTKAWEKLQELSFNIQTTATGGDSEFKLTAIGYQAQVDSTVGSAVEMIDITTANNYLVSVADSVLTAIYPNNLQVQLDTDGASTDTFWVNIWYTGIYSSTYQ